MTDEEVAHQYAISRTYPKFDSDYIARFVLREVEGAFLAGLNTGKIHWHDLQKDPSDLPENKRTVWCDHSDGYGKGFYDKDDSRWCIEGHLYCSTINAWCELPTFDKEK